MKFSEKMAEVEEIVNRLEREALPLEEALSLFEKGVSAIRECQVFLAEAKSLPPDSRRGNRSISGRKAVRGKKNDAARGFQSTLRKGQGIL